MRCGAVCRPGWDLVLLWLWCRLAATGLIRALAWELPYASGVALKKKRQKQNKMKTDSKQVFARGRGLARWTKYAKGLSGINLQLYNK